MRECSYCSEKLNTSDTRVKYCLECRNKKIPRKLALKKYNSSEKNRKVQKRWYYSDIKKTYESKNKYNRSEKGKAAKMRYYEKNKEIIMANILTRYRKQIVSRTNARDKMKRYKSKKICSVCNSVNKIHVHHIDFDPFNNELKNLQYLCSSCHGKVHAKENLKARLQ